jgi:Zn-dependent protease with chaperone function
MELATPGGPPAGFFLSLLTESFAVRALLGSVVAVALAAAATRGRWVRGTQGRRLVVLAPLLAAAAAGVASVLAAETYLPQLWVTSSALQSGQALELLGELRFIADARGVDVLVAGYGLVVVVLLARRAAGVATTRRLRAAATPLPRHHPVRVTSTRLAAGMGAGAVDVLLLPKCPGGALTVGTRRPAVLLDPQLLTGLDAQEVEGLIAHEVAHIVRRDTLLSMVVGVFRDLTFFLPTIHIAARWLCREREEGADELASAHTGRPAALASSILKVFEGAQPVDGRLHACGALAPAVSWRRFGMRPAVSPAVQVVSARVERLVSAVPGVSTLRQSAEVALAALVILAASTATLVVPQWIATDLGAYSLAFGYVPPPVQPVESPAFATFRALAPTSDAATGLQGWEHTHLRSPAITAELSSSCPCIESAAQWLAGTPASAPRSPQRMAWRSTGVPTWDVDPGPGSVRARPLLTLPEAQVGFFVVGRTTQG